ncbi:MAG: tRNA (adenosine(37)-N6)-threonylcarbamoyltransferase complex dimerization subunit type 1 TsaB [Candidatus Omnitrophota bacterium]
MNILAVETSSKKLCVGILNHKGRILEYNLDSGQRHTELILPTIKRALKNFKLGFRGIDYFAVGLGPGSFTGLRIGLATIKGFAAALEKPVIGLPTLDVIAHNALPAKSKIICPLIDARRNLLFTALYEVAREKLKRISPYLLIDLEGLFKIIKPSDSVAFLGDATMLYQPRLKQKIKRCLILEEDAWYPKAGNLIKLAGDLISKGKFKDAARIKPIYLYPKECQIRNIKS